MAGKNYGLNVILNLVSQQFNNGLNAAQGALRNFQATSRGFGAGISQGFKSMSGLSLGTLGLAGAVAVVGNEFRKSIQYSIAYEKTLSNLKALTGASSADMGYYKQAASELGNQFGKTGQEMAETFKIVGSGKSELLKNKEGLVAVSAAAITLSKAAGMEVPEAADALVVAMNQFNAPATQANRYINALAAGAKEGAAEIPNLSASLTKFGSVANALKIPVEQSIAMIEALSEKGLKDEVAGTGIKTFLLKLEQGAKNTRPSVVGLEQALDNLKKKNLSVNQAQNMFGMEAANVALALISQTERVKELNLAVTGTNEAYKQASINSDNVAGALTSLSASWTNAKDSFLNGKGALTSFLKDLVLGLKGAVEGFALLTKSSSQKVDDKYTRANKVETDSYSNQLGADSNLNNVIQDTYTFNRNKAGWQIRLAEAKRRGDTEEIRLAESKISLYNQLLSIARETIKVRTTPKDLNKGIIINEDGKKEKATPKESYLEEVRLNKSKYNDGLILEDEYTTNRINNLSKYLDELAKAHKKETNEYKNHLEEISKLNSEQFLNKDFEEQGKTDANTRKEEGKREEDNYFKEQEEQAKSYFDTLEEGAVVIKAMPVPVLKDNIDAATDALGYMADAFGSLSGAVGGGAAAWLSWGANALTAVSNMLPVLADLMVSNLAAGVSQQSKLPFPYNIVAMGATLAAGLATIASIPKFAEGGIVGGSSFSGDRVPALVNSGEMILNKGQQTNLFKMLNGNSSNNNDTGKELVTRISGSQLEFVLQKSRSKSNKIF